MGWLAVALLMLWLTGLVTGLALGGLLHLLLVAALATLLLAVRRTREPA